MAEPSQKLSIIIVTYNSAEVIAHCLRALPSRPDIEIIVVDNASIDNTLAIVADTRPDVTVRANGRNAGFAVAVNIGADIARADHLLLLNPDATIEGTEISRMLTFMDRHPDVGVAAPLVLDRDGAFRTLAVGYSPNLRRMFAHATGLSRLGRRVSVLRGHYLLRDQVMPGSSIDLDWVSGGCMFVRRSLWDDLAGLSERWFMYAEDIEFCLRAREADARVVLVSSARARHEVGGSSGASGDHVSTTWLTNLFDLYRSSIAVNRLQVELWRWTVVTGYALRAFALRVLAPSKVMDRKRFGAYASALRGRGE